MEKREVEVRVIRHGQAQHNLKEVEGRYLIKDPYLTELGKIQAKDLKLDIIPDVIFSSPLRRTIQTALIVRNGLKAKHEIPILLKEDLQEYSAGMIPCDTGSDPEILSKEFLKLDFSKLSKEWYSPKFEMKVRLLRFLEFLAEYLKTNGDVKNVVLVCHYGVIRGLFSDMRVKNCCVLKSNFDVREKILTFCSKL